MSSRVRVSANDGADGAGQRFRRTATDTVALPLFARIYRVFIGVDRYPIIDQPGNPAPRGGGGEGNRVGRRAFDHRHASG